jgi:hypothetical protein
MEELTSLAPAVGAPHTAAVALRRTRPSGSRFFILMSWNRSELAK